MSGLGENEKKIFKLNFNSCLEIFLFSKVLFDVLLSLLTLSLKYHEADDAELA